MLDDDDIDEVEGPGLPPLSPLTYLLRTHACMVAGEAIMAVALADSMFLSIKPDAARPKVILFLLLSFAPFTVVARFIGPFIKRISGGQRAVMFGVALLRAVIMVGMVSSIKSLALFPLAFGALVLSKTYSISKSSIVPAVVSGDARLVEANSKLAKVAGIIGFAIGVPAFLLQMMSTSVTLYVGAAVFLLAAYQAWHLPKSKVEPSGNPALEYRELHMPIVLQAAYTMRFLRGAVGFMFFHLAFWLRSEIGGTAWFAFAVAIGNFSILAANWVAPWIRDHMKTSTMLTVSLAAVAVGGVGAGISGVFIAGVLLTAVVNAAAAIGRVAFESTVQSNAPDADRASTFARFETHNQLAWVAGGVLPVILKFDGHVGSWCIGILGAIGMLVMMRGRAVTESRAARATDPGRPAR
jgi:hypothetical protein